VAAAGAAGIPLPLARRAGGRLHAPQQQRLRAAPTDGPSGSEEEEARVEVLEAATSGAGKKRRARKIPIRGVTPKEEADDATGAEWKEGQLFPEGWDQMDASQKARAPQRWAPPRAAAARSALFFCWGRAPAAPRPPVRPPARCIRPCRSLPPAACRRQLSCARRCERAAAAAAAAVPSRPPP